MSKLKRNVYPIPVKQKLSVYVRPKTMMELRIRSRAIGVTVSKLVSDIIEYYMTDTFGDGKNEDTTNS